MHLHRGHLAACAVAIVVAVGFLVATGGSAGGIGLLVAALACPIAMIVAMRLLMGGRPPVRPGEGEGSPEAVTPLGDGRDG